MQKENELTLDDLIVFYKEITQYDDFDPVEKAKDDFKCINNPGCKILYKKNEHGFVVYQDQYLSYYIGSLYIYPEFRNQGYGAQLISELPTDNPLSLYVYTKNPALRLYQRLGFKIIKEENKAYYMVRGINL
ncbi:MAG: GNAT family N-acetyltransferase [Paludibacteraceae bacterium]|nr:GNAT family N-acetyltransferase [Paludibacteraceae bacterium]